MPLTIPDTTIATKVAVPDGMTTLGNLVNTARGAQAYQQAQKLNPIQLQTAQQELTRLQQLTPQEVRKAVSEANVSEGTAQPRITSAQQAADLATAQTQSAHLNLANQKVNAVAGRLTSLINNPLILSAEQNPQAVNPDQLKGLLQQYGYEQADSLGLPRQQADQLIQPYLAQAQNPAGMRQFLKEKLLATMDQGARLNAMQPSGIAMNNGTQFKTVSNNEFGANPVGTTLPGTSDDVKLPPGQQQTVGTDASNRPMVVIRSPNGQVTGVSGVPIISRAGNTTPFFPPPGETQDTLKQMNDIRSGSNAAASQAPSQAFNANQIIKYANAGFTGGWKDFATKVFGGAFGTGDTATETQLLGHTIAQQTASLAQQAGLEGSDAKVALAGEMTADGKWTKDAIISSSRVMRAIGSTGTTLFNQGLENAVQKSGNPFAIRDFRNQWAQVANVDGIRLYDAMRNRDADPDGIKQVVDSLGGTKSPRYQAALFSIDRMRAVIQGDQ